MSSCGHCRTIRAPDEQPGVLLLTHPLPHTLAKLYKVLGGHYAYARSGRDSLAVTLPGGSRTGLLGLLEQHLSEAERQACKVLFLADGEALSFDKISSVQTLAAFSAVAQSGWLVAMLREDRFYADFQPIVSGTDPTRVFAYECLLRGRDETGATVAPGRIFGVARAAELLFHVDRAARLTAIRDASKYGVVTPIFINFNPTAIYDPAFCLKTTIQAIRAAGIAPERIVFEVVESDEVRDTQHLVEIVRFYRQQGFRIALDDLGAGYGSLNLLSSLRPDFVKFDRQLIYGVDADPYKQKVVRKLTEMARELGIQTIAEGVETECEMRWLVDQNVDHLQGFFFARPASPPPELQSNITTHNSLKKQPVWAAGMKAPL